MYCNIDLGKNIKAWEFFQTIKFAKFLENCCYSTKVRQDETLCIIFPEFYWFLFFSPSKYNNFRNGCVLDDVITFDYGVPFMFWEDINDDQESWINLKNFITKCDGIITNVDSLVHLIQIAMDSSQIATRFMANSDRCYKVRWWLLILTVQVKVSYKRTKMSSENAL